MHGIVLVVDTLSMCADNKQLEGLEGRFWASQMSRPQRPDIRVLCNQHCTGLLCLDLGPTLANQTMEEDQCTAYVQRRNIVSFEAFCHQTRDIS